MTNIEIFLVVVNIVLLLALLLRPEPRQPDPLRVNVELKDRHGNKADLKLLITEMVMEFKQLNKIFTAAVHYGFGPNSQYADKPKPNDNPSDKNT